MRGVDALRICPELIMVQVPVSHGKADCSIYREEGSAVLHVLSQTEYGKVVVQRVSVDEAYLDLTRPATAMLLSMGKKESLPDRLSLWDSENYGHLMKSQEWRNVVSSCKSSTHVAGFGGEGITTRTNDDMQSGGHHHSSSKMVIAAVQHGEKLSKWWNRGACEWTLQEMLLVCASSIMNILRKRVEDHWGYTVSAGISETKILAKLACGLHKPNHQTIVPSRCSDSLLENLPINRIIGLGGKLGDRVKSVLGLKLCGEVQKLALHQLWDKFGVHTGNAVYQLIRGEDTNNYIVDQIHTKTISCGKSFPGKAALQTIDDLDYWVQQLVMELQERLEGALKTSRKVASKLSVSFKDNIMNRSVSRSVVMSGGVSMVEAVIAAMVRFFKENQPVKPENGSGMEGDCCIFAISSLFVCAGTFVDAATPQITSFFHEEQQSSVRHDGCGDKVSEVVGSENSVEQKQLCGSAPVRIHLGRHTVVSQGKEGPTTTHLASNFREEESEMSHTSSSVSGVVNPYSKLKEAKELQGQSRNWSILSNTTNLQPKLQFETTPGPPSQSVFDKATTAFPSSDFVDTPTTSPIPQSSPNLRYHYQRRTKKKPKILPLAGSKCEWAVDVDAVDPETLGELGDCWTSLIKTQIEEAKQQKVLIAEREQQAKKQKQRKARHGIGRFLKKM